MREREEEGLRTTRTARRRRSGRGADSLGPIISGGDQLADEYQFYIDHQVQDRTPEKVLITNEFDRARLASAVESPRFRFDRVVHIRPALLETAYGQDIGELGPIIRQRKLISLADFLKELQSRFAH